MGEPTHSASTQPRAHAARTTSTATKRYRLLQLFNCPAPPEAPQKPTPRHTAPQRRARRPVLSERSESNGRKTNPPRSTMFQNVPPARSCRTNPPAIMAVSLNSPPTSRTEPPRTPDTAPVSREDRNRNVRRSTAHAADAARVAAASAPPPPTPPSPPAAGPKSGNPQATTRP